VPLEFLLSADGTEAPMGEESIFIDEDKAFQPRTKGNGVFLHTADPETGETEFSTSFAVTAQALTEGLKEYDLNALPGEFEIVLKQYPAYGRCEFSGHGMCVIDGEEEPQTLRHAVHFIRDQPWNVYHSAPIINMPVVKLIRQTIAIFFGQQLNRSDAFDIYLNEVKIGSADFRADLEKKAVAIYLGNAAPDQEIAEATAPDSWKYYTYSETDGGVTIGYTYTVIAAPVNLNIGDNVITLKNTGMGPNPPADYGYSYDLEVLYQIKDNDWGVIDTARPYIWPGNDWTTGFVFDPTMIKR
jgi:hypothetical protein